MWNTWTEHVVHSQEKTLNHRSVRWARSIGGHQQGTKQPGIPRTPGTDESHKGRAHYRWKCSINENLHCQKFGIKLLGLWECPGVGWEHRGRNQCAIPAEVLEGWSSATCSTWHHLLITWQRAQGHTRCFLQCHQNAGITVGRNQMFLSHFPGKTEKLFYLTYLPNPCPWECYLKHAWTAIHLECAACSNLCIDGGRNSTPEPVYCFYLWCCIRKKQDRWKCFCNEWLHHYIKSTR